MTPLYVSLYSLALVILALFLNLVSLHSSLDLSSKDKLIFLSLSLTSFVFLFAFFISLFSFFIFLLGKLQLLLLINSLDFLFLFFIFDSLDIILLLLLFKIFFDEYYLCILFRRYSKCFSFSF